MTTVRILRSKPYASTFFGLRSPNQKTSRTPRYKFMFYVNFKLSKDAIAYVGAQFNNDLPTYQNGVSFKIYGIDKPSVDLPVTTLNQYNRRRNVYSKVDYHPFNIKFYDTVDDKPLQLWRYYFTYYFGDSRISPGISGDTRKGETDLSETVVTPTLNKAEYWGLNPVKNDLYFFDKVELYAIFGKKYTQIDYIKPKISKIDWQQYDQNSSDPAEMSMQLQFEAIEYHDMATISNTDAEKFGFNIEQAVGDTYSNFPKTSSYGDYSNPSPDIQNSIRSYMNSPITNGNNVANGLGQNFQNANSLLNIFNGVDFNASSTQMGQVIGQTVQGTTLSPSLLNLYTDPSSISSYTGAGIINQPASPGVLGQYGSFDFGDQGQNV